MRQGVAVLLAVLCSGCGYGAGVYLVIEAPLTVPDECDRLRVVAHLDSLDGGALIHDAEFRPEGQFPHSLTLPTSRKEGRVVFDVQARKSDGAGAFEEVARGTGEVSLAPKELTVLVLQVKRSR